MSVDYGSDASLNVLVKFEACEKEQIRIPGSIQPHGSLIAYSTITGKVAYRSENLPDNFLSHIKVYNHQIHDYFPKNSKKFIVDGAVAFEFDNFDVSDDTSNFEIPTKSVLDIVANLSASKNFENLFERAATDIREFTGFDRVMIYKFDETWNGTVLSGARSDDLESFLGLHFPATDIPAQARELYLANWLRLIPDVNYKPVPILAIETQKPLDLSQSRFRSVSPIHLEYLKNMGVGASMSLSIVDQGRLWGLIACHHRTAKVLSQKLLDDCELLGRFVSLQIAVQEKSDLIAHRQVKRAVSEKIESSLFVENKSLEEGFQGRAFPAHDLLELVPASGIAYLNGNKIWSFGCCPTDADVFNIAGVISTHAKNATIFQTEKLGIDFPELSDLPPVSSGVLSIRIPDLTPSYLIWFRPEQKETVRWAGDPHKNPRDPLTPRNSFAAWSEVVSGKSKVWEKYEIEVANDFLQSIVKSNLLRQIKLEKKARQDAEESNQELDFFSYLVSHDLKEPLRGIKHFANFVKEDEALKISDESIENLDQILALSQRMGLTLDSLFEYSRLGMTQLGISEVDLNVELSELIASMKFQIETKNGFVKILKKLPQIRGDRIRIIEVFQNLISNSLKYNLSPHPEIEISCVENGEVPEFSVRDNGIGIDSKELPKTFESFTRLAGAERFGPGTGMGVTIVKRIIENTEARSK